MSYEEPCGRFQDEKKIEVIVEKSICNVLMGNTNVTLKVGLFGTMNEICYDI